MGLLHAYAACTFKLHLIQRRYSLYGMPESQSLKETLFVLCLTMYRSNLTIATHLIHCEVLLLSFTQLKVREGITYSLASYNMLNCIWNITILARASMYGNIVQEIARSSMTD